MALASINIPQLRRDAKRFARAQNITHSQALDQLARSRGYPNWSQLVKRSAAAAAPAGIGKPPALTHAEVRKMLGLPKMEVSPGEQKTILAIVRRYGDLVGTAVDFNGLSLIMDLQACHANGCPLELDELLHAERESDFVHDLAGIAQNMNRETGRLEGGFTPRYARMSRPSLALTE